MGEKHWEHYYHFSHSVEAKILLRMPGCTLLGCNPAHKEMFPGTNVNILWSREEFEEVLAPAEDGEAGNIPKDLRCYCEYISAVIALLQKDCVFEVLFKQLSEGKKPWHLGFEYYREDESRTYQIAKVFGRLLREERYPQVLEATLFKIPNLEVTIENGKSNGRPPKSFKASATFDGRLVAQSEPLPLKAQDHPEYLDMDELLVRLRDEPAAAPSLIEKYLKSIEKETNIFARDLLKTLVGDDLLKPRAPDPVEVQNVRDRLWDRPAVLRKFEGQLDGALMGLEQDDSWDELIQGFDARDQWRFRRYLNSDVLVNPPDTEEANRVRDKLSIPDIEREPVERRAYLVVDEQRREDGSGGGVIEVIRIVGREGDDLIGAVRAKYSELRALYPIDSYEIRESYGDGPDYLSEEARYLSRHSATEYAVSDCI